MILSRTAVHALRAAVHLAAQADTGPVRADDIAEALGVPRNYLSKILHALARNGLLVSTRGPHGGFVLARAPSDIPLREVIAPFDDITDQSGCLLGRDRCSDADPCPAHGAWKEISQRLRAFLTETTLAQLPGDVADDL